MEKWNRTLMVMVKLIYLIFHEKDQVDQFDALKMRAIPYAS